MAHFSAQGRTIEKNLLPQKFLQMELEMDFSDFKIQKFLIFPEMKPCTFWSQPSKFFPKIILIFFN